MTASDIAQPNGRFLDKCKLQAWILIDGLYTKCAAVGIRVVRETIVKVAWEDLPDNAIVTQVNGRKDPGFWWVSYDGAFLYDVPSVPPATFSQYVARLPEWEEALLHHTDLLFDPFTVATMLSSGVRSVSDGSEWDQTQGSFGCSLSDKNGIRCATGMGPAHGSSPTSYRSESYGMLSILCFLRRLAEFTGHLSPWEGIVATDSDSLLKTLRKKTVAVTTPTEDTPSQHSIGAFPLDLLLPEWDVVRGIQVMAQSMPGLELRYVAGHQDKKKAIGQLSLLARLNVEAEDAIANKYQRDYGHHQPIVPLTAWAGVHLILPAGTITSHYETALRYQATSAPLQHHMMKRYSWTLEVCNWKAHGKSLKRHLSKRTHLIKFVHGILPTKATLHRKDPLRNRCPACGNCLETWSHIPRCKINAREEWRKALLAAMNNTCNKWSTDPQLCLILCNAISGWLDHSETSPEAFVLCPSPYPPEYGRLIRHQNAIGWDQILLGRFSLEWDKLQDAFYSRQLNTSQNKARTSHRWQIAIICTGWARWFLLWAMRNNDLHGADASSRAQVIRKEVDRSLRKIYDMRSQMEPSMQQVLCKDLMEHFSKTTSYNQNWLAVYGPLVRESIKRAKSLAVQNVRPITEWLVRKLKS